MKSLVGLVSVATLTGFSWFGWQGMHEGMSDTLSEIATVELAKYHVEGVSVEFDHLDGLVSGASTPERKTEVREILAGKLPMSRLVFTDEMASNSTDVAFPDPDSSTNSTDDTTIDVYSQALVDSEAAIQQGKANGTDLSFADPKLADESKSEHVASQPKPDPAIEPVQTQPPGATSETLAKSTTDDNSAPESAEQSIDEQSIDELPTDSEVADTNNSAAQDPEDQSEIATAAPEQLETATSSPTTDDQIASAAESPSKPASSTTSQPDVDDVTALPDQPDTSSVAPAIDDLTGEKPTATAATSMPNDPAEQTSRAVAASPTTQEDLPSPRATSTETNVGAITVSTPTVTAPAKNEPTEADSPGLVETGNEGEQASDENENQTTSGAAAAPEVASDQREIDEPSDPNNSTEDQAEQSPPAEEVQVAGTLDSTPATADLSTQTNEQAEQQRVDQTDEQNEEPAIAILPPQAPPDQAATATSADESNSAVPSNEPQDLQPESEPKVSDASDDDSSTQPLPSAQLPATSPIASDTADADAKQQTAENQPSHKGKARLGVYMTNNPNDSIVRILDPQSAAENAGIRVGDRIVQIGLMQVSEFKDVSTAIAKLRPDDVVRIWFERSGTLYVVDTRMKGDASAPDAITPSMPQP